MGMFDRILGSLGVRSGNGHAPRSDALDAAIAHAARVADTEVSVDYLAGMTVSRRQVTMGADGADPLVAAIDAAVALAPRDPDLLFAKSEAHYSRLDGEAGQRVRKHLLEIAPTHFDAVMRERHFAEWDHVFSHSSWSEASRSVPAAMLGLQEEGNVVQIVRDGVTPTVAIAIPGPAEAFARDVVETRWKPLWVDTPHGPLFEHYVMLRLRGGAIKRQELMISPYPVQPVHPRHGDCLIRRLATLSSIFIVFNNGPKVLHNVRFALPSPVRRELRRIARKLDGLRLPPDHQQRLLAASSWYMRNSDLASISF